jgi:hypothetical protein
MAKPMPRAPPVTIAVRFFRSMTFMSDEPLTCHCERTEAIQPTYDLDCFVAALLAMTIRTSPGPRL